jgi:micrococcal nuclease
MRYLLLALLVFVAAPAVAQMRAYDGDTITLADGEKIRVLGVDTAEIKCRCPAECSLAISARDFVQEQLDTKAIEIRRARGRDKYGRTLAYILVDGRDLAALLIERGLGRAYNGGRRQPWCEGPAQ